MSEKFTHKLEIQQNLEIQTPLPDSIDSLITRVQDLEKETEELKKYEYMTDKDVVEKIKQIKQEMISREDIRKIKEEAYRGIDYVEYIDEISTFIDKQNKLQKSGKPSLEIEKQALTDSEEEELDIRDGYYALMPPAGNYHKNKITVSTSNTLSDRNISPVGVLYNLATKGIDPSMIVVQHEVIHHYQRSRESSLLSRLLKKFSESKHSKDLLDEIHARLHHSMMGAIWAFDDDKNIKSLSSNKYGLQKNEQDDLIKASDCIKKLYAINVSNRRIARLVRETKSLEDLSLFEQEIKEVMSEKNIGQKELDALVSIEELQRHLVHMRSRKIAQELIKELSHW
jgi:hypothetical protein